MHRTRSIILAAAAALTLGFGAAANAAPYASGIAVSGTSGSFILNEAADNVVIHFGDGSSQIINSPAAGTVNFALPSAGTTFSVTAYKQAAPGYLQDVTLQIGADAKNKVFQNPGGIAVNTNPNTAAFGRVYVANRSSGTGTNGSFSRSVGDGVYGFNADQSTLFGAAAQTAGLPFSASSLSPYRVSIAPDGGVYVSDASTVSTNGTIWHTSADLTAGYNVLFGTQANAGSDNHGNIFSNVYASGSSANGNLQLYAIDAGMGGPNNDQFNSLRRYDVGSLTSAPAAPLNQTLIANVLPLSTIGSLTTDLAHSAQTGNFFLSLNRTAGNESGVVETDANGNKIFDSLTATSNAGLDGDPTASGTQDYLRGVLGIAISPDGKTLALAQSNAAIGLLSIKPDGTPDITSYEQLPNAFTLLSSYGTLGSAEVAFDAAGNLYAVAAGAGNQTMRVFAPGGATAYQTSFDGSQYSFSAVAVPEPSALGLLALGSLTMLRKRKA